MLIFQCRIIVIKRPILPSPPWRTASDLGAVFASASGPSRSTSSPQDAGSRGAIYCAHFLCLPPSPLFTACKGVTLVKPDERLERKSWLLRSPVGAANYCVLLERSSRPSCSALCAGYLFLSSAVFDMLVCNACMRKVALHDRAITPLPVLPAVTLVKPG